MSINASYYDLTQLDWGADNSDDGAIPQSTANFWKPLVQEFKRAFFSIDENRLEHRGNQQTLSIDQRTKKNLQVQLDYIAEKYDANSPAYSWWDIISQAFYGGATGSPALRPAAAWIAAKINRATPEYWLTHGVKFEEVVIRGSMVDGPMTISLKGIGRGFRLDTNNYVQGTTTRRTALTKDPIIPSNDVTIYVNGVDVTTLVQEWILTMRRTYDKRGRSATVSGTSSQMALTGFNYREFIPSLFDGKLELTLDPYGTTTAQIIDQLNDTALSTVSISAQNVANGKTITFSASKTKQADQEYAEGKSPATISLLIDGSTFNVTTN